MRYASGQHSVFAIVLLLPFREGWQGFVEQSHCLSDSCEFRHGVHLEFGRNGRAVKLNRPFVDAQVGRDLLVHLAGDDVAQDLQLATREGIESGPQRVPVSILGALPRMK